MLKPGCMDATGLKKTTLEDQAAELRRLASRRMESAVTETVDVSRTQAANLMLLAQVVRKQGVAA